jgi:nucleoside-diphosphate-sugar epimerase
MSGLRRVLIIGCGYVGLELGRQLVAADHKVFGLRRSAANVGELQAAGITPVVGDLTHPTTLDTLPGGFDWVVNTVSSSRGGLAEYRQVYREGTRNLIDWMRRHPPAAFAYTSSTSVYGQTDGSWVDETSPTRPGTETGSVLVEVEQQLLEAARAGQVPARLLRVAGIYGPGRGHLFRQFVHGEARLRGDGSRWLNMIHRDDVASALLAVLGSGLAGEIYNAADDEPVTERDFLRWLAENLGRPLPGPGAEAERAARKRGLTNKRVSNRKLRALGWTPHFPTFRDGYAQAVQDVRSATALLLPGSNPA